MRCYVLRTPKGPFESGRVLFVLHEQAEEAVRHIKECPHCPDYKVRLETFDGPVYVQPPRKLPDHLVPEDLRPKPPAPGLSVSWPALLGTVAASLGLFLFPPFMGWLR
jgi:hypothetical protein